MIRKIIEIDEEKCTGCGLCVDACHEGAIELIDGKAKLIRDDYCDGLGDCLPTCPTGAIEIIEREAVAYDEEAVMLKNKQVAQNIEESVNRPLPCGCPGSAVKTIERKESNNPLQILMESELRQWPIQIKLVPTKAAWFDGAKLLVAADCTAYAYANFHQDFIKNHVTVVGCPKLDDLDYSDKLTDIIKNNDIKSITVVRMEVPCCGGIENAVKKAMKNSGKFMPWNVVTIATDGSILDKM